MATQLLDQQVFLNSIRLVPDAISFKIINIYLHFEKVLGKMYFYVLKNESIYMIYIISQREQVYCEGHAKVFGFLFTLYH